MKRDWIFLFPRSEETYSGKFFIRAPKSLHRKLAKMAEKEGVSLNQYLVATLAEPSAGMKPSAERNAEWHSNILLYRKAFPLWKGFCVI
jgi:hypothetical protein